MLRPWLMVLAVVSCTTCGTESRSTGQLAASTEPIASLREADAVALLTAVLDSLPRYGGMDLAYLDPRAWRLDPENGRHESPEPPRDLPAWMVNTLLSSGKFAGLCRADAEDRCDVPREAGIFQFTPPCRLNHSDTVAVGVSEGYIRPLDDTGPWVGFGATSFVLLLRRGDGWAVVDIRLQVIS
ncbi:hypothetical protein YTPLAS18_40370 [Nitrospira sp.]|nr:hypothetical protein YTPLAS18_40370 [Nitrospira sp.]